MFVSAEVDFSTQTAETTEWDTTVKDSSAEARPTWVLYVEFAVLLVNVILAIGGNSLVIVLVICRRSLRSRGNVFIANLALADVLYGLMEVVMLTHVTMRIRNPELRGHGLLSPELCNLQGVLITALLLASIYNLTAIAINRYIRVCKSNRYDTLCGKYSVLLLAAFCWPLSIAMSLIPLRKESGIVFDDRINVCIYDRGHDLVQLTMQGVLGVSLPSGVIIYCYLQIYKEVRASRKRITQRGPADDDVAKKSKQSTKQTMGRFIVFCSFMLLWSPFSTVTSLDLFIDVPGVYHMASALVVCFSSSINPILYGVFNTNFKKEYVVVFRKLLCRKNRVTTMNETHTTNM